jgi:hypothetical protein
MSPKPKLYIVLTHTGTWFTNLIKAYTREPFNHASLAFDPELREIYSFGRKYENNPFSGGFIRENVLGPLFVSEERVTTCAIYSCEVGTAAYERIRKTIADMEERKHEYKYNFIGLFGVLFNRRLKRDKAYFCSQFVAAMLQSGGVALTNKCPELTTPGDIGRSDRLQLVYTGKLRDYPPLRLRLEPECTANPAIGIKSGTA